MSSDVSVDCFLSLWINLRNENNLHDIYITDSALGGQFWCNIRVPAVPCRNFDDSTCLLLTFSRQINIDIEVAILNCWWNFYTPTFLMNSLCLNTNVRAGVFSRCISFEPWLIRGSKTIRNNRIKRLLLVHLTPTSLFQ